jgi:hypothetical protein
MRYRLSIALAVTATALIAALAPAAGASTNTKVSIEPNAQVMTLGFVIVGVHYQCFGGNGVVSVQVTQFPPDNWITTSGTGAQTVTCDGQTHEASIPVQGSFGYDAGKATATATLTAPSGSATDTREININVT